jgi:hypothetical protein
MKTAYGCPKGFVARTGPPSQELVGVRLPLARCSDGAAVFSTADGWIYVSNSEVGGNRGRRGRLRFNSWRGD